MTRDEAIQKLNSLKFGPSCGEGPWLVDALSALGLLELKQSLFEAATEPNLRTPQESVR